MPIVQLKMLVMGDASFLKTVVLLCFSSFMLNVASKLKKGHMFLTRCVFLNFCFVCFEPLYHSGDNFFVADSR